MKKKYCINKKLKNLLLIHFLILVPKTKPKKFLATITLFLITIEQEDISKENEVVENKHPHYSQLEKKMSNNSITTNWRKILMWKKEWFGLSFICKICFVAVYFASTVASCKCFSIIYLSFNLFVLSQIYRIIILKNKEVVSYQKHLLFM